MGVITKTTEQINTLLDKVEGMPEEGVIGKTPVLQTGTTTTLNAGEKATSEVVRSGDDDEGNPIYVLNFGIPKGKDGQSTGGGGEVGSTIDWENVLNKPVWVESTTKPTYTASEVGALPANTEFKTINGQSILGSGDISIGGTGGTSDYNSLSNRPAIGGVTLTSESTLDNIGAQPKLESGTNIKTINGQSILGSGNIDIQGGGGGGTSKYEIDISMFASLTSSSTSEEISAAIGGLGGFTAIIEAIESGSTILLKEPNMNMIEQPLSVSINYEGTMQGVMFTSTLFVSPLSRITISYAGGNFMFEKKVLIREA
ncbi:hypothetical protein QVN91_07770 [Bacteroides caecigallinarum]|nr:hypothetical protein [Bacteroides caecigallinarum]